MEHKVAKIKASSAAKDLQDLVRLSTSNGGLLSDNLRRTAWPVLLGCRGAKEPAWRELPEHRDEGQVRLDVDRSFVYYPDSAVSSPKLCRS